MSRRALLVGASSGPLDAASREPLRLVPSGTTLPSRVPAVTVSVSMAKGASK